MRTFCFLVLLVLAAMPARGQTIDDGIMLPKRNLLVGDMYTHESWDEYWEGTLKRGNGNIGTLTTRTNQWFVNYGVTDRLNVLATIPHVWTSASQGVLHGMEGFQDISLGAKFNLLEKKATRIGRVRAIAAASGGLPLTNYTPDFYPLSIGSASKRLSGRATLNLLSHAGWYINGTTAYTWRESVTLDRPYYFTDGRLFMTNEVEMPNVWDYAASVGMMRPSILAEFSFSQQRTQGGGDIRRQDMPFVSNRMNFSRVGGMVMAPIPGLRTLSAQFAYGYILEGRNVGQATTLTAGLMYRLPFGNAVP